MRKISWLLTLAIPAIMISCQKEAVSKTETTSRDGEVVIAAAPGAPDGAHEYQLNIIGVERGHTADMDGNNGRRIFVPLWGNAKIKLAEGDYGVTDANGLDNDGASFTLPSPDPDNDGITEYSVWARSLGKPGGSSVMTTCATSKITGEELCSTKNEVSVRSTGKSTFKDVSAALLYVYADVDGDGDLDRVPLFDDSMENYYWDYENTGLRLLQLRFYEVPSDVTDELPEIEL